ncbi:MAG TPA: Rpn family recombination-promoting nuclease/putative transposase [Polyangium sp.]|nr:Rpn family recombination-promoting nuclease/putative transposase [Polyangium sp.]
MYSVFADPKTDFVFKRIFGAEARKPLLTALLNHLLELEGDRRIVELQHLPSDQHVDIPELKLSIVDVKCIDAAGRRFVVEMQVLNVEGFEKRVVYNASKAYVMQLRNADEYPALCDVVGLTICNFNLWPDVDEHGNYKVPMLSRWRMQEQTRGEKGLSQIQYAFLELPKYAAGDEPTSLIDKWAYFFREAQNLDVVPPVLAEKPFLEAFEVARRATFSAYEWEAYDRAKMAEQDARGALSLVRKEGLRDGRREGILEEKRNSILRIFELRRFDVSTEQRQRLDTCTEPSVLDQWFARAVSVQSVDDVFAP